MTTDTRQTVRVHVNIDISPASIQTVVENAKQMVGRDENGRYNVDTADKLGEMISKFLLEKNFDAYVQDTDNYSS